MIVMMVAVEDHFGVEYEGCNRVTCDDVPNDLCHTYGNLGNLGASSGIFRS
jgi:hypothetical protein